MINLYYISSSNLNSSSVTVVPDNSLYQYNTTYGTSNVQTTYYGVSLEIKANVYESLESYTSTVGTLRANIISGSSTLISFPLDSVNIYYNIPYVYNISNPVTTSLASLDLNFRLINVDPSFANEPFWGYYISSSGFFLYNSGSTSTGSSYNTLLTNTLYTLAISSSKVFNYTSSLSLYDTTFGPGASSSRGDIIFNLTGSADFLLTSSFYPTASRTYLAVLYISGNYS